MKLSITSAIVYKNIKLFKQIIAKHLQDSCPQFTAYIHRQTGELLFQDAIEPNRKLNLKVYKPLCIHFRAKTGFEILEDETNEVLFECADLAPAARHILSQLIATLNHFVLKTPHPENIKEVLEELSQADLEAPMPTHLAKDLIHEAWHDASRLEAEHLLEHKAVGTYLFRKDEYATLLEAQLSSRFRQPIKCITLTYLKPHDCVRDLTLASKNSHWYIYDDDPSLEETAYSDIDALLKDLQGDLTEPLLYEKTA